MQDALSLDKRKRKVDDVNAMSFFRTFSPDSLCVLQYILVVWLHTFANMFLYMQN